jgi:vancomycin resistance protein YoaR
VADPAEPPLTVPANEFFTWLTWPTGYDTATLEAKLADQTAAWNREPINAEFALTPDGKKLTAFAPHRMGRQLQLQALVQDIQRSLTELEQSAELPPQPIMVTTQFVEAAPTVTLESTNTLGIKERIAVGTSTYKGSIPNRIFNVGLTAERVHGSIVAPGEEFSFNEAVGEISGKTGYKSAYVIMNGRTQLGDGGGVCQVSTTLFRAILDGGLPVTRWKAHSYRVGYYEQGNQPGFDATVYAPSVDFRFRNDTGHSIAIAAYPDSTSQFLTVELWGTSDGRDSEVSNYKIWNQRSAPAPSYVEDPTLPAGKRQQIDWAAAGANTSFQYTVKDASGAVIHDREFVSIFRPWQAVYLVGTGQ